MPGRTPASARPRRPPEPGADDRGSVTVEAALALCGLVVVLAVAVAAMGAVIATIRCTDAARELARLAARGEPERGREVATALAPTGSRLTLTHDGDLVIAEATLDVLPPLPLRTGGRAVAAVEPGVLATPVPASASRAGP